MDERTAVIINSLAAKLGTTSEYLWGVLTKQAPINSAVALLQYGLVFVLCYFTYRQFKLAAKDGWDGPSGINVVAILLALASTVMVGAVFFDLPDTASGFFNPEYWALHKVLSAAHGK